MLSRIIAHWTAGTYKVSENEKSHYHFLFDGEGKEYSGKFKPEANIAPKKGKYAAHTLNCNTGSIGVSCAAMGGAVENKTNGTWPLNEKQFEAMCRKIAELCEKYGIPVTRRTVLSHAEVQPTLGIKQKGKWDIAILPWNGVKGAIQCGDYMRNRVLHYMKQSEPAEPEGARSVIVAAGDTLWSISKKHSVSLERLLKINNLTKDSVIKPLDVVLLDPLPEPAPMPEAKPQALLGGIIATAGLELAERIIRPRIEKVIDSAAKDKDHSLQPADAEPLVDVLTKNVAVEVKDEMKAMKDYAENKEPAIRSYSVTGAVTIVIGAVTAARAALMDGFQFDADIEILAGSAVTIIGVGWQMYGRFFRNKPIGK